MALVEGGKESTAVASSQGLRLFLSLLPLPPALDFHGGQAFNVFSPFSGASVSPFPGSLP